MKLKSILKYMRKDSIFEIFIYDEKTHRIGKRVIYDFVTCRNYSKFSSATRLKKGELDYYKDYYIMSIKAFHDCEPQLTFVICKNFEDTKKDNMFLML